eukprot:3104852-Rhodomonas_salina.4
MLPGTLRFTAWPRRLRVSTASHLPRYCSRRPPDAIAGTDVALLPTRRAGAQELAVEWARDSAQVCLRGSWNWGAAMVCEDI